MTYNPNSPCVVGNEWRVGSDFVQFVNSDVSDAGTVDVLVESTASETVDALWFFIDPGIGAAFEDVFREGWYAAEVYPVAALGGFFPTTTQYVPSSDTVGGASTATRAMPSGGTVTGDLVTSPLYPTIDNLTLSQGVFNGVQTQDLDWVTTVNGEPGFFSCYFNNIVGTLTGEQVLAVKLVALVDLLGSQKGCTFRPFILRGGRWDSGVQSVSGPQPAGGRRLEGVWYADPLERCPWLPDGVEDFDDANSDAAAGITMDATGDDTNFPAIYSMWLEVMHRPEVRVAYGCTPTLERGWNRIELQEPDGTPGWAKSNATDYLITFRRRGGTTTEGGAPVPILVGESPHNVRGVAVNFDALTKQPLSYVETDGGPGVVLEVGAGASVDSQPYTSADGDDFLPLEVDDDFSAVNVAHSLTQIITAQDNADYGHVRVMARLEADTADGGLACRLKSLDGLTLIAGPILWDADDLLLSPKTRYQLLEDFLPGFTALVSGTEYRLEFSSWASEGSGWRVQVLSALEEVAQSPAGSESVTFGGITEHARPDGTPVEWADVAVTLGIVPDSVENFTATAAGEEDCVSYVTLAWDEVVVGGGCSFAQYELERSEDGQVTWQRIANITDQALETVNDYESVRNAEACYRIRVRREDGTPSLWSDVACATPVMTCCGYYFASNWAQGYDVWIDDLRPRDFEFIDDEETRHHKVHGADYQRAFYTGRYRGVRLKPTLLVAHEGGLHGTTATPTPGVHAFDALRILAGRLPDPDTGAKVFTPYVAVHTQDGDRYFASVQVPTGHRNEPGGEYLLDTIITEVTATPTPFDAQVAS